jgi:hypothetical protein
VYVQAATTVSPIHETVGTSTVGGAAVSLVTVNVRVVPHGDEFSPSVALT